MSFYVSPVRKFGKKQENNTLLMKFEEFSNLGIVAVTVKN